MNRLLNSGTVECTFVLFILTANLLVVLGAARVDAKSNLACLKLPHYRLGPFLRSCRAAFESGYEVIAIG